MTTQQTGTARLESLNPDLWEPVLGKELERLLKSPNVPQNSEVQANIRNSTLSILSRCLNPKNEDSPSRTGLIIGYVQSGKTLSFTAVAAAAHDNGYRTVVVIAGSSLNLADQNKDRVASDLGVSEGFDRPWNRAHNPTLNAVENLRAGLSGWQHGRGHSLLLTSLKHQTHVKNLGLVLEALGEEAQPMLIIDDEADQISLNSKINDDETSVNYSEILNLREKASRHTYLQYTATPQANIFIPLWDQLSPDFAETLTPGPGYVGGIRFFINRPDELLKPIPRDDLQLADDLSFPPPSLDEALRVFYIGVVQGILEYEDSGSADSKINRSMMVHPARSQNSHQIFAQWIRAKRDAWLRLLDEPVSDPDRVELIVQFREAYVDLASTDREGRLHQFEHILDRLAELIASTKITEVNSRPGVDKRDWRQEWGSTYSWILVGGQNLDRGFTVEGLTVTYMPRDIGGRQADTLQQRARFFGYKANFEDLCRVYLGPDTRTGFKNYVPHESSMRKFIERHKDELKDPSIPRQFELDPSLLPTRRQVVEQYPKKKVFNDGWLFQRGVVGRVPRCQLNGDVVDGYFKSNGGGLGGTNWPWLTNTTGISDEHKHSVLSDTPLQSLYENVLTELVMPDPDEHLRWQVALDMVRNALEKFPNLVGTVVRMRPNSQPFRGLDEDGHIKQVAAGAYPPKEPYSYLGDRCVQLADMTLQIHRFDVGQGADAKKSKSRIIEANGVAVVGLWLGKKVNRAYIQQDQSKP